ncbi:MAG TPA: DUF3592 domain-containing protein [Gemmataceae bacterium]
METQRSDSPGPGVWAGLALVCLVGLAICLRYTFAEYRVHFTYQPATAVVQGKRIVPSGSFGDRFAPQLLLVYEVNGRTYGTWAYDRHYHLGLAPGGSERALAILNEYEYGEEVRCWYDPDDPRRAVVVRPSRWALFAGFGGALLALLAAAGVGAARALRGGREARPEPAPNRAREAAVPQPQGSLVGAT